MNTTTTNKNTTTTTNKNNILALAQNAKATILDTLDNYSNLQIYLFIAVPILFLLAYYIYKNNFTAKNINSINNLQDYKKTIKMEKLPQCYELDKSMQYKLCDYYIAASYMTPCIGKQHYDYVSTDMIITVLESGARFIQIPVCESDVSQMAVPVVATAEYGQKLITSLNTLDMRTVLQVIRSSAFLIDKKKINYPLFIQFVLNTNNINTLNTLTEMLEEYMDDLIILPSKYNRFPIFLEKLCNLLGKIIIFATPEYKGSKLEKYIMPNDNMFQTFHYSEIAGLSMPPEFSYTTFYNNKLSMKYQTKSDKLFKQKYPSIDFIIRNSENIKDSIMNNKEILNNLAYFNKVGITMIKPNNPGDIILQNFDPKEAIYYGCQIILMNYQINDDFMKTYISIFKDASFKLKPSGLRFSEKEDGITTRDMTAIYKAIIPKNDNILNEIYYKYNNLLIALEAYSLPNTYITQIENNLRFQVGSNSVVLSGAAGIKQNKIGLNQCFVVNKSTLSLGSEDIPVFLVSAANLSQYISVDNGGNGFSLAPLAKTNKDIRGQSFYFEKPKNNASVENSDDANSNILVSLSTIDPNNKKYLAFNNRNVVASGDSSQIIALNNMTFKLIPVPFVIQIRLITLFNGSVKTIGQIVGLIENSTTDATPYTLEPVNKTRNFIYLKDEFYMKNAKNNTYLYYSDNDPKYLYDELPTPNENSKFTLQLKNGFYLLVNTKNECLVVFQNNLLKFINPEQVISNENLFKIDLQYVI